ncbi:hypothetical protein A0H81_05675 [Grifola frondosa]|uniref:Uncharacterized protein n=1 Tax=Grifola frondosa TaxID=5627 RepID=A0A1C7MCF7_GRIFR|nr:hypothetical protein A0H81_05675 [Grifola frondosa]
MVSFPSHSSQHLHPRLHPARVSLATNATRIPTWRMDPAVSTLAHVRTGAGTLARPCLSVSGGGTCAFIQR